MHNAKYPFSGIPHCSRTETDQGSSTSKSCHEASKADLPTTTANPPSYQANSSTIKKPTKERGTSEGSVDTVAGVYKRSGQMLQYHLEGGGSKTPFSGHVVKTKTRPTKERPNRQAYHFKSDRWRNCGDMSRFKFLRLLLLLKPSISKLICGLILNMPFCCQYVLCVFYSQGLSLFTAR